MATTTIPWGDGSGDNIYLTYPSASGDQTVEVSSDANTGSARSKTVVFSTGSISETLTVNQRGIPRQYTLSVNPSSYTGNSTTVTNPANAYTPESSSTYARMTIPRGTNPNAHVYYKFDTSSIPQDAVIDSVKCVVKIRSNYNIAGHYVQMYSGTTAMGTSQHFSNTETTYTFSGVSWSREEVSDVRFYAYGARGNNTATLYMYIYGATLTIKYTV